jgi:hypothetical protein
MLGKGDIIDFKPFALQRTVCGTNAMFLCPLFSTTELNAPRDNFNGPRYFNGQQYSPG